MKQEYKTYNDVTREILDTIEVGNLVKFFEEQKPYRVVAVSDNYFLVIRQCFKTIDYLVCTKEKESYKSYQEVDYTNFGRIRSGFSYSKDKYQYITAPFEYDWNNKEFLNKYLEGFELGDNKIGGLGGKHFKNISIK